MNNILTLHHSLQAVGLDISGCDANGNVHLNAPDTNSLIPLVIAAHEKRLKSDECLALKTALGGETDPRWLAYVDARKAPVKEKREARYRSKETDNLFMKAFETAEGAIDTVISGVSVRLPSTAKLQDWENKKLQIRNELPYE